MARYDFGFGKLYAKLVYLTNTSGETYKVKMADGTVKTFKKWVQDTSQTVPFDPEGVASSVSIEVNTDETMLEGAIVETTSGNLQGSVLGMTLVPKDIMTTKMEYNVSIELLGASVDNASFEKIFDLIEKGWYLDAELYPISSRNNTTVKLHSPTEPPVTVDTDGDGNPDAVDGASILSYQFALKVKNYSPSFEPTSFTKYSINASLIPLRREEA